MTPTPSLAHALESATWRHLYALARTHGLRVSNRWTKTELAASLETHLGQPQTFQTIIPQLPPAVHDALRALVQAHGRLPLLAFTRQFGAIQPYKPWRSQKADSAPWLQPATPASHLCYLGLFFPLPTKPKPGEIAAASVPAEILEQIRPLFASDGSSLALRPTPRPGLPPDFLWHLALFVAAPTAAPVTLRNQRWLPPTLLKALSARMGLDQNPAFVLRRSERAMPYLAFLHYVAECAGLLSHGSHLQLTALGWQWLAAPTAERWQQIWHSLTHADPAQVGSYRFGWPALNSHGWSLLTEQLGRLSLQQAYPLDNLLADLGATDTFGHLGATDNDGPLLQLLRGPLHWLGLVTVGRRLVPQPSPAPDSAQDLTLDPAHTPRTETLSPLPPADEDWPDILGADPEDPATDTAHSGPSAADLALRLTPLGAWLLNVAGWGAPVFLKPQPAQIVQTEPDTLLLGPATQPLHLARLAPYARWDAPCHPDPAQRLYLTAEMVGQAVANGTPLAQIVNDLHQALGRPPSHRQISQLRAWAATGQQVHVRQVTLLKTDNAARMGELRSRRHIRRFLGDALSPTRSEINPADLNSLRQSLAAYGLPIAVDPLAVPALDPSPETTPEYPPAATPLLLTAALVLQGLASHVDLPVRLSADLLQTLAQALQPPERQAAQLHARRILEEVEAAIAGYLRLPSWQIDVQGEQVYARIKKALETNEEITIVYWNAESGQPIQRRIIPYHIETRRRIRYLHAWCHLRQDERIFRLDRIERIVDDSATPP